MMERFRAGARPERRVDEPRGRREDDHRTVGRLEAVGRWVVQPLVVKGALIAVGLAVGWIVAIWRLPEGHAQLARQVNELDVRTLRNDSLSFDDRASLHVEVEGVKAEVQELRESTADVKLGLCLQTPLDYRALMKCEPNLPPPRRP